MKRETSEKKEQRINCAFDVVLFVYGINGESGTAWLEKCQRINHNLLSDFAIQLWLDAL